MGVASGCGEQEVGAASGSGWNLWVPNSYFFTSHGAYIYLRYIAMIYTHSIGKQL